MTPASAALAELPWDTEEPGPVLAPHSAGEPVALSSSTGILHPGTRPLGVLMVGAVGYEEMCARSTWRTLAQMISAEGLPALRFDLPGCGDALDVAEPEGLADWRAAVLEAAGELRRRTGVPAIAVVAQGLGAALAVELADVLDPVAFVAMAPVSRGRTALRELQAWSRMLHESIGIGRDPDDSSDLAVAGHALHPARAEAIRAIDLARLETMPAPEVLVVARHNHMGDAGLADRLAALGAAVARTEYEGYGSLITDPTQARPPVGTLARIVAWLAERAPAGAARPTSLPVKAPALVGPDFHETPLRFGTEGALFGVLCRPRRPAGARVAVIANAGRDYHIGWGRSSVVIARELARQGIASFRYDGASIGDSLATAGTETVLFSDEHVANARAAIDHLAGLGLTEVTMVGRCSGAYVAWRCAVEEPRVRAAVLVNISRFVPEPAERMAEAIRYGHRTARSFATALLRGETWRRLIAGELRVGPAGLFIARRSLDRLRTRFGGILGADPAVRAVRRDLARAVRRGVRLDLVFSEGDAGLHELARYFGPGGRDLAGAGLHMTPDADHNFTHARMRRRLVEIVSGLLA